MATLEGMPILITMAQWRFWRYVATGALRGRPVLFLTGPTPARYTIAAG